METNLTFTAILGEVPSAALGKPSKVAEHYQVRICRVSEPIATLKLDSPELCADYWREIISAKSWFDPEKEQVIALCLNTKYAIQSFALVSMGTLNESIAHPRDIFRPAIAQGAYAVIVMHNHPSGDPAPSQADHSLTRRLSEAGELLQIKLLDHVIIGKPAEGRLHYFSFREAGIV